jgi:hypothetical protein
VRLKFSNMETAPVVRIKKGGSYFRTTFFVDASPRGIEPLLPG